MEPAPDRKAAPPRAQRILTAARACFARQGFQGASMLSIAGEAGISVGHIYRYFAGKDEVIASLVEQDACEITRHIESLQGRPDEIADALLQHVQRLNALGHTGLWLEIMAEAARNDRIAQLIKTAGERARASLRRAALGPESGARPLSEDEVDACLYLVGVLVRGMQVGAFADGCPPPRVLERVRALLTEALSCGRGDAVSGDPARVSLRRA